MMTQLNLNMGELNMTEQKPTTYQQNQAIFDSLNDRFPNIVALSKITTSLLQMDEAVGSSGGGCARKWVAGDNNPGSGSERRAGEYLRRIANGQPSIAQPAVAPVVSGQSASMFIISVPEAAKAKADMLFNMLRNIGCEIVDF